MNMVEILTTAPTHIPVAMYPRVQSQMRAKVPALRATAPAISCKMAEPTNVFGNGGMSPSMIY